MKDDARQEVFRASYKKNLKIVGSFLLSATTPGPIGWAGVPLSAAGDL